MLELNFNALDEFGVISSPIETVMFLCHACRECRIEALACKTDFSANCISASVDQGMHLMSELSRQTFSNSRIHTFSTHFLSN